MESRDEKAWKWLNENDLSYKIWEKKYRYNNESFDEWLDRVSGGDKEVRQLIQNKDFIFGGRILSGRGIANAKYSLSNCYVITPPEDNIESIFECATKMARTFSYGGGAGTDLSKLAPKGAVVRNSAKQSDGVVPFVELLSSVTGTIAQNSRRGAAIVTLDCTHPDIIDFINLKTDLNKCNFANISIKVNDEFMNAAINKQPWKLSFTRKETGETIEKEVNADDVLTLLAQRNWEMAEPKQYNLGSLNSSIAGKLSTIWYMPISREIKLLYYDYNNWIPSETIEMGNLSHRVEYTQASGNGEQSND